MPVSCSSDLRRYGLVGSYKLGCGTLPKVRVKSAYEPTCLFSFASSAHMLVIRPCLGHPPFILRTKKTDPNTLCTSICPVAQALVHNCTLQADAPYFTANIRRKTKIHAVVRSVRKILELKRCIAAPADATAISTDVSWTSSFDSHAARDALNQSLASGPRSLMRTATRFLYPSLLQC